MGYRQWTSAKGSHKCVWIAKSGPFKETGKSTFNQFLPRVTTKGMLQVGDTFEGPIAKKFSKNRIVGYSHRTFFVTICYVNRLDSIGEITHVHSGS